MATIDADEIICQLLDNNGMFPGDPQCFAIHRYWSLLKKDFTFHVAYQQRDIDAMCDSPYVKNPELLWSRESGLTELGKHVRIEMFADAVKSKSDREK